MIKRLIVGNWKMNPSTLEEAKKLARRVKKLAVNLKHTETVICPPFPFILPCMPRKEAKNFHIGAQSVSSEETGGPYTGEISSVMLRNIGVEYAIIGHSEQRKKGDTDETVSKKLKNALDAGLTAIVCVGEVVRDDQGIYLASLKTQISNSLSNVAKSRAKDIIIAYEPVWAIGAQEAMSPNDVQEMSIFVKKIFADLFTPETGVKTMVLYGGAVNFRNAPDIMKIGKVDGLLVGRESVNAAGFLELLKAID